MPYGLPQPLTGNELVTIWQEQNGQIAKCSMSLNQLAAIFVASTLPTTRPTTAGVWWNNNGVVCIS